MVIKMDYSKLFRKFKIRLTAEGVIRAFLFGISSAFLFLLLFSLVYHLVGNELPAVITVLLCSAVFVISSIVVFALAFYPTKKRIARRIDELGMQERVGTMYEYKDDTSQMADIQRNDTLKRMKELSGRSLVSHIKTKEILSCMLCVILALGTLFIPYDLFDVPSNAEDREEEIFRQEVIKDLIEDLRKEVEKSDNKEELDKKLNDQIDKLESELKKSDSKLDNISSISHTRNEIDKIMDDAITKDEIGQSLQNHELTSKLGEAISKGDKNKVSEAIDDLKNKLGEDPDLKKELADNIRDSLAESETKEGDELHDALAYLAEKLDKVPSDEALDKAEEDINKALDDQKKLEDEAKKLDKLLSDAKDELLEGEKKPEPGEGEGEPQEGEDGEKEPGGANQTGEGEGEGEKPGDGEGDKPGEGEGDKPGEGEGDKPGEGGDDTAGGGDGGELIPGKMLEQIYDPISGSVKYGDVISLYYDEYCRALKNGLLSDADRQLMDAYFEAILKY